MNETESRTETRNATIWTWAIVTEASALASVAVMPYVLDMQKDRLAEANAKRLTMGKRPINPLTLTLAAFAQSHVTFGVSAALGLRAADRIGLGLPLLRARLSGKPSGWRLSGVATYAAVGAGAALLTAALDKSLFGEVRRRMAQRGVREPGAWKGLLASAYGAIGEEVLMRLGLQTLIAAGLRRLRAETTTPPSGAVMWPAIAISNLAFGAGHLPATRALAPLSPLVVARALVLNVTVGVACGYLYWTEGLEAAMIAHGSADLVLHVAGAIVQRRGG